jgi:cell division protease FtsH
MDQRRAGPQNNPGGVPQQWRSLIWLALLTLAMLWFWQEGARQVATRTIPYSQFKDYVRNGQVTECSVQQTEIVGKIQPQAELTSKPAEPNAKSETKTAPATNPEAKTRSESAAKTKGTEPSAKSEAKATSSTTLEARTGSEAAAKTKGTEPGAPSETKAVPAPTPEAKKGSEVSFESTSQAKGKDEKSQPALEKAFAFRTVRVDDPDLVRDLEKAGVKFTGVAPGFMSEFLWAWILPIGLMVLLWMYLSRKMGGMGKSMMSFGSSHAKLIAEKDIDVTFRDVAGCEEAKYELQEVVEFLKHPERYQALGARIPKGVLLVGPPGTGKTLLARAVAGEAVVPFFSISGSEFVEMFVGVGAARVRDLFQQAKTNAPCIVFIDELDAVGRERGVRMGMANDEREQTLNQLLVGLDGFEANLGVVVLAATNRPEVLDRALLRPGRFDRQVVVDAPDLEGRDAILKLHAHGKPLGADVDLHKIAQETPGFSGADLANVINEAALLAARHDESKVSQKDMEEAVEKVVAGPERKSRRLSKEDKRRVAYHEVGHALVAVHSKHADVVHKISIVPRGRAALGYTLQLPEGDQYLMSQAELTDKIKGLLGGRAAEEVVFAEITTGAENDLEHATALARQMVCMYGMSESVGLVHCAQHMNPFLAVAGDGALQRDCSEQTAREIDEEVKKILDAAYADSKQVLQQYRAQLDLVANELMQRETLDAQTFKNLINQPAAVSQ